MEDYKEKYEMALERAKKNYDAAQDLCNGSQIGVECFKNTLTNIFPELGESEDERIRKRFIDLIYKVYVNTNYITCVELENIIAWLEKQGDTTSDIRYDGVNAGASLSVVNGKPFDYEHATITQKDFAPKAEPKFKVGDMVCKKKDNSFCATINSITDTVYLCDVFDSDGDYDDDYAFLISEQDEYELVTKKIEPQPTWSDEDEKMYKIALSCVETLEDISNGKNMHADVKEWLKSLKNRIGG